MAERSGMSLRRYQEFESGRGAFNPTLDTLLKLAEALELHVDELTRRPSEKELERSLEKNTRRASESPRE